MKKLIIPLVFCFCAITAHARPSIHNPPTNTHIYHYSDNNAQTKQIATTALIVAAFTLFIVVAESNKTTGDSGYDRYLQENNKF